MKGAKWYVWFSFISFTILSVDAHVKVHPNNWFWRSLKWDTPLGRSLAKNLFISWFVYIVFPLVGVALVVFVIRSMFGYPPFVQTIFNVLYFVFAYFLGVYATYRLQVWSEKNLPQKPKK